MFDINIVSTGSKGNCVVIDKHIVIDMGLAYKYTKDVLEQAKLLFITHRHVDHLNPTVIKRLHKEKPWRMQHLLYTNFNVLEKIRTVKEMEEFNIPKEHVLEYGVTFYIDNDYRMIDETKYAVDPTTFEVVAKEELFFEEDDVNVPTVRYKITTFELVHDVPNQGFVIENTNHNKLIYATDTSTMKHAPKDKYDFILVEGNYDEDKVNQDLLSDDDKVRDRAYRNLRHLSVQQFEDFCKQNGKHNSVIYQLHESEGFGLRSDLSEIID